MYTRGARFFDTAARRRRRTAAPPPLLEDATNLVDDTPATTCSLCDESGEEPLTF
jgi:hypothetical protein